VERIAAKLAQMRQEKRPSVMINNNPRIVNYAAPSIDYILAQKRIFTRPEIGPVPADFHKHIAADKKITARIIINIPAHTTGTVSVAISARDKPIVINSAADFSHERFFRRRNTGPADRPDLALTKIP
jgi:hypothetical protein